MPKMPLFGQNRKLGQILLQTSLQIEKPKKWPFFAIFIEICSKIGGPKMALSSQKGHFPIGFWAKKGYFDPFFDPFWGHFHRDLQ